MRKTRKQLKFTKNFAPLVRKYKPQISKEISYLTIAVKGQPTVYATENQSLIGWFIMHEYASGVYGTEGTYVSPEHQRMGLATRLWEEMFKRVKPVKVHTGGATEAGFHFVRQMQQHFKGKVAVIVRSL